MCTVRYLLKNQADVLLKNKAGDLPIHLACQYAQQGHKHGESLLSKFFVLILDL